MIARPPPEAGEEWLRILLQFKSERQVAVGRGDRKGLRRNQAGPRDRVGARDQDHLNSPLKPFDHYFLLPGAHRGPVQKLHELRS